MSESDTSDNEMTLNFDEKLINEVHKYPTLYDFNRNDYSGAEKKANVWKTNMVAPRSAEVSSTVTIKNLVILQSHFCDER